MKESLPRDRRLEVTSVPIACQVEESGTRLDLYLSRKTGRSRVFVQEQIKHGRVLVNGESITKAAHKLRVGDALTATFVDETRITLAPVPGELDILYEDESLLALNKRQGVVVHPAVGHRGETLVHYLLHYLQSERAFPSLSPTRPGIVHRLDRGTSGVILIAKTRPVLESLSRQFKDRLIKKEYESVVWGVPGAEGKLESRIGRDTRDRKKMSSRTASGREAITHWKRVEAFRHFSHLALFPHTGRTHQLRVHLSEHGHAIVGDTLYGRGSTSKRLASLSERIAQCLEAVKYPFLHARALRLTHPVSGKELYFEAPRPGVFEAFLSLLRSDDR